MSKMKKAYIAATVYSMIVSLSFLFTKTALAYSDTANILAHRFTISFITVLAILFISKRKLNLDFKDYLHILPLSIFQPLLFFTFQALGLARVTSFEGGIISASAPIFTLIMASLFLHERTSWIEKASIMLSVCGVAFIFAMEGIDFQDNNFIGLILMLLSAIFSSAYSVFAKKLVSKYNFMQITFVLISMAFICFNSFSIVDYLVQGKILEYFNAFNSPKFIYSILYLGVLSSVATTLLINYALKEISASRIGVFSSLSTLLTILAGVIFLKEKLYLYHIIGSVIILAGVIATNMKLKRQSFGDHLGTVVKGPKR